jgi:gamma-glutamyltranspeptidase/glutathione hydrolase
MRMAKTARARWWFPVIAAGVLACSIPCRELRADEFRRHVVVSQQGDASEAGREVLRAGGNAVDAAVVTAFVLSVTHPAAGNLGGGGFIVAYRAETKEVFTFDFRETAPLASTPKMYLGPDGRPLPGHRAGPRAAGVPGTVRGLALAHSRLGRSEWADLVRPAVRLARDGFSISATLARGLNGQLFDPKAVDVANVPEDLGDARDRMSAFPSSIKAYRKPDGSPWREGDRLVQSDLARTLERIATRGPDDFYTGETARMIAAHCAKERGLITAEDLSSYRAVERPPIHGTFRGHDVYGMAPPASGGILVVEMLRILERYDLKADGPGSPATIHRVAEAMRRGFYTRATEIADPAVVKVPVDRLVSPSYADELARSITDRATPSASLAPFRIEGAEGADTTHLSTLDGDGNAVALTYTLEEGYGCKSVVEGAGFLLNNEMGDFNLVPGQTDAAGRIGTAPNTIAPGKRMLSSQSPTIVVKDCKVRLVTGSPGGRTIPNTTLWVVLNVVEFGLDPTAAVQAPRTHHPWFPDVLSLEGRGWPEATLADLRGRGHKLRVGGVQGDAHTIVVDPATGKIHGVADPRRRTSRAAGD